MFLVCGLVVASIVFTFCFDQSHEPVHSRCSGLLWAPLLNHRTEIHALIADVDITEQRGEVALAVILITLHIRAD